MRSRAMLGADCKYVAKAIHCLATWI